MAFHRFIRDSTGWETLADPVLFSCPHLAIHGPTLRSPSRREPFQWTVCHRKAAVVVVPMTGAGELILIRQERAPLRAAIWEFPAGQIDSAAETDGAAIRATGLRELREEAGYALGPDGRVTGLGHFFSSPGFSDEVAHLILATPVVAHPGGAAHEASEAIVECRAFAPAAVAGMIASGEISDANTLTAFARLVARGLWPAAV